MNDLLGNRIKMLRTACDITQEQMADKLSISRQKYSRIEGGTNNITLEILSKIAATLDVAVSDITKVLDEQPSVAYRSSMLPDSSTDEIFGMLDLFYANKHMYMKLQPSSDE